MPVEIAQTNPPRQAGLTELADMPRMLVALRPDLIRLARRLADSEDEAQDLVQETLLRLWRRRVALCEVSEPRAYGRAALRNLYRQSLRRAPHAAEDSTHEPMIDPAVFARLALQELERAIARLPAEQGAVIRLVASGETSPQDLARRLGCPPGTVMSRLARARAQLRTEMGIGPDAPVRSLI